MTGNGHQTPPNNNNGQLYISKQKTDATLWVINVLKASKSEIGKWILTLEELGIVLGNEP